MEKRIRGIALIDFRHKEFSVSRTPGGCPAGNVSTDQKTGIKAELRQRVRRHCGNRGFAVRSRDRDRVFKQCSEVRQRFSTPHDRRAAPFRFHEFRIVRRSR